MNQSMFGALRDARRAGREGREGILRRQRSRLLEAVEYARTHSPFYRELYRELPSPVEDVTTLPVTDKAILMDRFDDWVTDRRVNLAMVTEYVADPDLAGHPLLGTYTVTTTSGTTGKRAIFLTDEHSTRVVVALGMRASGRAMSRPKVVARLIRRLGKSAVLVPTGGHFGTYVGVAQQTRTSRAKARATEIIPVTDPIQEIVARLNAQRPAYLESYTTVLDLLASEQEAGRLSIRPGIVRIGGETISDQEVARLGRVFDASVLAFYGANEMPAMMVRCAHGWYHAHDDWTILEPVDAEYRPTPAGEWSDTVLISVLYRREQPILRYDLGDAILRRPDPCPCGNPFTAFQVGGRASDTLRFERADGSEVLLSPLVLETQIERTGGLDVFQLRQAGPDTLRLRMRVSAGADPDEVWRSAYANLGQLLADNGLSNVGIERAAEPPEQSTGGKYRSIIPFS